MSRVDFEAGERECVTDAFPTHIGGQSPPFFTLFDRICSLFRECVSEKGDAYAPGFFAFSQTFGDKYTISPGVSRIFEETDKKEVILDE